MPHSTKDKHTQWRLKTKPKRNAAYNEWYQKNKEVIAAKKKRYRLENIEMHREHGRRAKKSRRQMIAEYKLERGCATCGYRGHPEALQFDHLPGSDKRQHISKMFAAKWEDVLAEINKCQILCANCHAIVTADRRREKRLIKKAEQEKKEQQMRLRLA